MDRHPIRIYADTSVFGGVYDTEFAEPSRRFFDEVRTGRFDLVVSPLIADETADAPAEVLSLFGEIARMADSVVVSQEAIALQEAYVSAGIVTEKSTTDALHVALATVSECAAIVSWNFRHIVHFERIPLYNAVNVIHGFSQISIHSPAEVIDYEDQDL